MSQLTQRLERDLREVAGGARPSPSAWESIEARLGDDAEPELALLLAPGVGRSKRPIWPAVVAAALVMIVGTIAVLARAGEDSSDFATDLTTTFVSPRNGFSFKHPDGAAVTPAVENDSYDLVEIGLSAVFGGRSAELLDEDMVDGTGRPVGADEWIDDLLADDPAFAGGCGVPRDQQAAITIDGQPGRVAECPNRIEATVVVDERLYVFTLSHERSDPRAVFDAFVATVDLTPETAINYPAMTTLFVSPTYGYSFRYFDRGGLVPATKHWDPVHQPPFDDIDFDAQFDTVQTALSGYFTAGSTEIPDGVSIDALVDEYISPAGCGVARREQAEIAIDGRSGRVAECGDGVEATVVDGGRLYLFTLGADREDPAYVRAWFDAWVATIDLTPETAAVP